MKLTIVILAINSIFTWRKTINMSPLKNMYDNTNKQKMLRYNKNIKQHGHKIIKCSQIMKEKVAAHLKS